MTQKYPVSTNPLPLSDTAPPLTTNSGGFSRIARRMAVTGCLLIAATFVPFVAHADESTVGSAAVMNDEVAVEDEDPDSADDGSSALGSLFRFYDLKDAEPISAKEEEALLGNWGDSDAEDGD